MKGGDKMVVDLAKFGEWLLEERTRRDIRQMQIENASGVSHVMISKYENGADIRVSTLSKILDALDYEPVVIIRRKRK
jgi:transcriptional regulator with XRE-family HTH domain